ncbi:winged helix-turn-helix transcriptional regulator [Chitinophaga sp. Ak27]|uniref:winged helix-turn-helix transcriptional regulator n=1 Tax=Chitinophaga sp. Ak27 TaxID=2726116 RepID=UPI00145F4546|nr:helix-turn-helix domain-containing protein [Chitinophaga sp. Ak27]NLU96407.1 helix-turn-helix transcriptional regulator [Chitinophaga sp. Ak27]
MSKIKPTSTHDENKRMLEAECPEIYASNLINGQWTVAICCYLGAGKMRFATLKKKLPTITDRMLTLELRKMEEKGLISRTVFAEVPVRVEYELTPIGHELIPVIQQLEIWGKKHKALFDKE